MVPWATRSVVRAMRQLAASFETQGLQVGGSPTATAFSETQGRKVSLSPRAICAVVYPGGFRQRFAPSQTKEWKSLSCLGMYLIKRAPKDQGGFRQRCSPPQVKWRGTLCCPGLYSIKRAAQNPRLCKGFFSLRRRRKKAAVGR